MDRADAASNAGVRERFPPPQVAGWRRDSVPRRTADTRRWSEPSRPGGLTCRGMATELRVGAAAGDAELAAGAGVVVPAPGAQRAGRAARRAVARAGRSYTRLQIRGQRTRWASCSRAGR